MNKKLTLVIVIVIVLAIGTGIFIYQNNKAEPLKETDPSKVPGIKKVEDGIITVNAYTKEERFHPNMPQAKADEIAKKILAMEAKKPKPGGTLVEHDAWAKERRPLLNELTNSFYRYKDGKATKMGEKEIQEIVIFEATFTGVYD